MCALPQVNPASIYVYLALNLTSSRVKRTEGWRQSESGFGLRAASWSSRGGAHTQCLRTVLMQSAHAECPHKVPTQSAHLSKVLERNVDRAFRNVLSDRANR